MHFEFLLVLDFEATCADAKATPAWWNPKLQEIIEFPAALISSREQRIVDRFATFVRPVHQPTLTAFCTTLTTIGQEDVAKAPDITSATRAFIGWLEGHGASAANTCTITCGDWDLLRMWPRQVAHTSALVTPDVFARWCNLKRAFEAHLARPYLGSFDMLEMLAALDLEHIGIHHRGKDDVENLSRVVLSMLNRGYSFAHTSK